MTWTETFQTFSGFLSLPPVALPFVISFVKSFIPEAWLTEFGINVS
jgi:hypothetical protein